MNATMTVELGFGKANFPRTAASFLCQKVSPSATGFASRVSAINSGKSQYGAGREYLPGGIPNRGTVWVRPVEHPEGTVLLLQSSWTRSQVPIRDGAIALRLRENAPAWEIHYRLPTDAENILGDHVTAFVGRADILTCDDLESLGITFPPHWARRYLQEDEVDECFHIVRTASAVTPKPDIVVVGQGVDARTVEVAAAAPRRMVFRRRG